MKSVNADLLIHTFNVHLNLGDQGPPGVKGTVIETFCSANFTNGYA